MSASLFPLDVAAGKFGDSTACVDGSREHTYADLAAAVSRLASRMYQEGIRTGDRVCFVPAQNWETLQVFWALFRVGAVACPISLRLPTEAREELARQVGAPHVYDEESIHRLIANAESVDEDDVPRDVHHDDQPATIMFSSGTSGVPKAVVHDLRAHLINAQGSNDNIPLQRSDRWLWSLPTHHVSGLSILFRCAQAGAAVVTMSDAEHLGDAVSGQGVTHLSVVGTQLKRLLAEPGFPPPALKAVLLGGSACPANLVREAVAAGVPLHTTYGLTEMASQVTTTPVGLPDEKLSTAGCVLPGRELAISELGEILVRGPTLCRGYLRGERLEPITNADGWFPTGDLGYLDGDGHLTVRGRRDNMFISGGENIHPEEIESRLLELAGVHQAIVVAVADPEYGHRPVAFLDADPFDLDSARQELGRSLPSFKIPLAFHAWPKQACGDGIKPSRIALAKLAAAYSDSPNRESMPGKRLG